MFSDVHSHILCGVDDGARNAKETQQCLRQLNQTGITHLAFTPHYYPHKESIRSFLERRNRAFESVKEFPEAEGFTFTLGSEVLLGETLFNNENLRPLCYEGTNFMLTELEYSTYFTDAMQYRLLHLIEDFDIVPVLAHIDRYPFLWKNLRLLETLKHMGCRFQMNISAMNGFFSSLQVMKLYKNGFLDFLGEDVHRSVLPAVEKEKLFSTVRRKYPSFSKKLSERAAAEIFGTR